LWRRCPHNSDRAFPKAFPLERQKWGRRSYYPRFPGDVMARFFHPASSSPAYSAP
jgi:hypothetical protein